MKDSHSLLLSRPVGLMTAAKPDTELMASHGQNSGINGTKGRMRVHIMRPAYTSSCRHDDAVMDLTEAARRQQVAIEPLLRCRSGEGQHHLAAYYENTRFLSLPQPSGGPYPVGPSASPLLGQLEAKAALSDLIVRASLPNSRLKDLNSLGTRCEFHGLSSHNSAGNMLSTQKLFERPTSPGTPTSKPKAQYESQTLPPNSLEQALAIEALRAISNPYSYNACMYPQQSNAISMEKSSLYQGTWPKREHVHLGLDGQGCVHRARAPTKRSLPQEGSLELHSSTPMQKKRKKTVTSRAEDPVSKPNDVSRTPTKKTNKLRTVHKHKLRGITQRPSGKWEAQCWFASKSRYIGVYDAPDEAALAHEVAREMLQGTITTTEHMDAKISEAREAAQTAVAVFFRKKQTKR